MTKTKELVVAATEEQLAILDKSFPVAEDSRAPRLPRMGFLSKDIVEEKGTGKNKKITVVQSAGTFYTEVETDEVSEETGKKVWSKEFFGDQEPLDAVIFYHRKQLRMFDSVDNIYINTPIFDDNEEIVPLYKGATQIDKGLPASLQAKYPALTAKGKPSSKLKSEVILYLLVNEEVYQMNLSQSSKFSFQTYGRTTKVNHVITTLSMSDEMTQGTNTYRHIVFSSKGVMTQKQADLVLPVVKELNDYISAKKTAYGGQSQEEIAKMNADFEGINN